MNWRSPDVEVHANGWPAIVIITILLLAFVNSIMNFALMIVRAL